MDPGDDRRPLAGDRDGSDANAGASSGRRDAALFGGVVVVLLVTVALVTGGGATRTDAAGTPTPAAAPATAAPEPVITMRVRSVEPCGPRCRSVTVALSNHGSAAAADVSVTTRITAGDSHVWEGRADVGRVGADETVVRTRTVEVGYLDAARIEANDGVVRIETTVRTASGTRVFTERRAVL